MKPNAVLGIALAGWVVACGSVNAETLKLSAAANAKEAAKATLAYAESDYDKAQVYDKQVFQLSLDKQVLGTLVSGGGLFLGQAQVNSTCFVALVEPNGKVALTPTVGVARWEAWNCLSVEAVATVSPQPQTGFGRIVVIHRGSTGADPQPVNVVLAWNPKVRSFEVDLDASLKVRAVSDATVAAVRKALQ